MDRVSEAKAESTKDYHQYSGWVAPLEVSIDDLLPQVTRDRDDHDAFELRQARRQLEQISEAARVFALELDLQKLFKAIAYYTREILRADQATFFSNFKGQLTAESRAPATAAPLPIASGPVQWCVKYLKSKVDNRPSDPTLRNAIYVPLVGTQNRVLGVIEACNKRTGGFFTEQDLRVADCLARVACSAVDRDLLFGRMEEWRKSIETLLSFNATVNQQLEPSEMVRELVANVTGFLDADGGAAGIVIREDSKLFTVADSFYYDGKTHEYSRRWNAKEGIPGVVIETEFPLLINDYQSNDLADPNLVSRFDIGSCICVPIKNSKEVVLGFFKLHRKIGAPEFTWQDAAFLESLGNTAAVAIENAHLVRSLEHKNEQIKNLSQEHVRRLEEERQHIARELHDQSGQVLVGLKLRLQLLTRLLNDEQTEAKQELATLQVQLNQAATQLKNLAKKLRPPTLDELGFEASVRQLVSEYRRQVEFSTQVEFHAEPELSKEEETALFRITQECLTNVAKHSGASQVRISFWKKIDHQAFSITDNGNGFVPDASTSGLGLIGIKERVKMLGGSLTISSSRNGTTICILLGDSDQ